MLTSSVNKTKNQQAPGPHRSHEQQLYIKTINVNRSLHFWISFPNMYTNHQLANLISQGLNV